MCPPGEIKGKKKSTGLLLLEPKETVNLIKQKEKGPGKTQSTALG